MASPVRTRPVEDSVPKIDHELAVGEDLQFQRRWWRFEHIAWALFTVIVALDLLGAFGRGPLAKGTLKTPDGAMTLEYERIERFRTPSILTIHFGPAAVRDNKIQLWVSQTVIKELGNQRIIPQPESSVLSPDGILYTWAASDHPDSAAFALEPAKAGMEHFVLRLPLTGEELGARIFVMP